MLKKYADILILSLIILLFVIYKSSSLTLPYYWDEAWSYKPAVEEMVQHGPSLLPGSISVENYKGHPLFFYFLSSLWLNIFPDTILFSKIFALTISVLTLVFTYLLAKLFTQKHIATLSVLLLVSQAIFLAQSTLLLPEMLLALLSLAGLYFYIKNKKIWYAVFASLLLLTKETGAMLVLSVFVYDFITDKEKNIKKYLFEKWYLFIPVLPVLLFFIYQKLMFGWFFYPEHIGYIKFSEFPDKFSAYLAYLLIYQSRNVLFFSIVLLIIISLIIKTKVKINRNIYLLLGFMLLYISFLSINFYSTRYILSVIPLFVILINYFLFIYIKNKKIVALVMLVFSAVSITYGFTHLKESDHNLGYDNTIKVQQKMIKYCEINNLYDKNIATHFLMKINMTDSVCGYLSLKKAFKIQDKINDSTDYVIVSSNEQNEEINQKLKKIPAKLIIEYKEKQSWCKLYKIE